MSLTPDSQLDLLFSPDLIPQSIRDSLHADLHVRPLASSDHSRGHLDVLSVLTLAPNEGPAPWTERYNLMKSINSVSPTYFPIAILSKTNDRIVAVGTVILERKFLRGMGTVGHIEDIAVHKEGQGKGLGKTLISTLSALSARTGAYKTILDCNKDNIAFYEKCGFTHKEYEMVLYTPEDQVKAFKESQAKSKA